MFIRKIQSAEKSAQYKDAPKFGYIYFAPENLGDYQDALKFELTVKHFPKLRN